MANLPIFLYQENGNQLLPPYPLLPYNASQEETLKTHILHPGTERVILTVRLLEVVLVGNVPQQVLTLVKPPARGFRLQLKSKIMEDRQKMEHVVLLIPNLGFQMESFQELGWDVPLEEESQFEDSIVSFSFPRTCSMKCMAWNCRGMMNPNISRCVWDLVHFFQVSLLILTETRTTAERAAVVAKNMPFDEWFFTNSIGMLVVLGFYDELINFRWMFSPLLSRRSMLW